MRRRWQSRAYTQENNQRAQSSVPRMAGGLSSGDPLAVNIHDIYRLFWEVNHCLSKLEQSGEVVGLEPLDWLVKARSALCNAAELLENRPRIVETAIQTENETTP